MLTRIRGIARLGYPVLFVVMAMAVAPLHAVEPLPEPLTLDYALSLADEAQHPDLLSQRAAETSAEAEMMGVEADNALSVSVEGRARWVKPPSIAEDQDITDDHKLSLYVRKPLYDFGYSDARRSAALQANRGAELRYREALMQRRVTIMRAFFDVLLADMEYARDNEALATAYIALDRLRNRQELGQASDIAVLELDNEYQNVRTQLSLSENRQRASRARLANILGRPGMLPSELQKPQLNAHKGKLPEYDALVTRALANNPRIQALEAELLAAQKRLEAARASDNPRLNGELEASEYSRELGSSDRYRAGVVLEVPLYTGGRTDAAVAEQQANVYRIQAGLDQARYDLRQQVLDLWLELQNLKLKRDRAYSQQDFRELYLDRSRANYEMEFKADLGDAMVRLSEAQLDLARNNYDFAIAWERMKALTGDDIPDGAAGGADK
ncbi:MAG: TolC family protein [Candidatus Thiodiazotropha sp.]